MPFLFVGRGLELAKNATAILFGASNASEILQRISEEELLLIFGDAAFASLAPEPGTTVIDMAMKARLFPTKGVSHYVSLNISRRVFF